MTVAPGNNSTADDALLQRAEGGDRQAVAQLLALQRDYLRRMLEARMEPALRQRVDPSDIIQETLVQATRRLDDYLVRRPTTFRLWIRRKALEQLVNARRHHFAQRRAVDHSRSLADVSSMAIARTLVTGSPSAALHRKEQAARVGAAVQELSQDDREIVLLRNVEQLSNSEVAQLLGIDAKTASKRYGRAILKLHSKLK